MSEDEGRTRSWVEFAFTHWAPIAAVLAAFVYAGSRAWLVEFYGHFDVSPEEVGLGQSSAVTRAVPVAILLVVAVFGSVVLFAVARRVRRAVPKAIEWLATRVFPVGDQGDDDPSSHRVVRWLNQRSLGLASGQAHFTLVLLPVYGIVAVLSIFVIAATLPGRVARDLEAGRRPSSLARFLLPLETPCVEIVWLGVPAARLDKPQVGLYLGRSDGISVVAMRAGWTARLPSDQMVMSSRPDTSCRPPVQQAPGKQP